MGSHENERMRRFEALFAAHRSDVVAYCGWRAGSAGDAQDAAAEVFLTAWRRLDHVPDGDRARVWLYATARRVIANQRRSRRRRAALEERLTLEAAVHDEPSTPSREETIVREALHLPVRDRETLLLAEWEGLSPAEIAAVTGCLAVTARGRLHRARCRFRAVFEELLERDAQAEREAAALASVPVPSAGCRQHSPRRSGHEHPGEPRSPAQRQSPPRARLRRVGRHDRV
jgi:RNA polymerase sigma-70 factor (ECF subfamily)